MTVFSFDDLAWTNEPWTPRYISTDVWLDSASTTTLTVTSNAVEQWADISGNTRNFTQTDSTRRPPYNSRTLNGIKVLDFSTHWLNGSYTKTYTAQSCFLVCLYTSGSAAFGRFYTQSDGSDDFSTSGHYIPLLRASGAQSAGSYVGGALSASVSYTYDTWGILSSVHSGSAIINYANGTASSSASHTLNKQFTRQRIGDHIVATPGSFLVGGIAELIILDSAASTTTRQLIEGYLAHKWGLTANLPSGHPYKSAAPTT